MPSIVLSFPTSEYHMNFKEPFITDGLNKKLGVIVPRGVYRGFNLAATANPLEVELQVDATHGNSVAVVLDDDGHAITVERSAAITVDLTAHANTLVVVALYANYVVGGATTAQIRVYEVDPTDELGAAVEEPQLVILGSVLVPAAGAIPAANVTPDRRTVAWRESAKDANQGVQVVLNPDFDQARTGAIGAIGNQPIPSWNVNSLTTTLATQTWSITTTTVRRGPHALQVVGAGVVTGGSGEFAVNDALWAVEPGTRVTASVYLSSAGTAWSGVSTGGCQGLQVAFYDKDFTFLQANLVSNEALTGTFSWTKVESTFDAPASAAYMEVWVGLRSSAGAVSGTLVFDEIRVWVHSVEPGQEAVWGRKAFTSEPVGVMELAPRRGLATSGDDYVDMSLRLMLSSAGPPLSYSWAHRNGVLDWDLNASGMGIKIDRRIRDLGSRLVSSVADAETARISMTHAAQATAAYTLLWETDSPSESAKARCYLRQVVANLPSLVWTLNAAWDNTASQWEADNTSFSATKLEVQADYFRYFRRTAPTGASWADTAWSKETFEIDILSTGAVASLYDGRLAFTDATAFTNPATATAPTKNTLYAKNTCKAWARITGDGTPTVDAGFNVASVSIIGTTVLEVGLHTAVDTMCATATVQELSDKFVAVSVIDTTTLRLSAYDLSTGTIVDFTSSPTSIALVVHGEQT